MGPDGRSDQKAALASQRACQRDPDLWPAASSPARDVRGNHAVRSRERLLLPSCLLCRVRGAVTQWNITAPSRLHVTITFSPWHLNETG